MESSQAKPKFSDYLSILYKWKKLLIINLLIIIVLATVYSFLIPEQFKATSIVMLPAETNLGLGGIGALIGGGGLGSLGSQVLGMSSLSQDIVLGILYSRTTLTEVINKFDLMEYYGRHDENMDLTLRDFSNDLVFEPTEFGMIEVSVINENPLLSAKMANYFVRLADSINIELNIEQAKNNRLFIEKRYKKNIADLKAAEDSFYLFQKKYGIVAVPEQLEASIKAAAELEAMYAQHEITAELYKQQYGLDSPFYKSALAQAEIIKKRIRELKDKQSLSYPSNILFPFSKLPDVSINYYRVYRDVEIQTKILEFVLPLYEQALVEEQKSIPTLYVIDKAVPPQWKDSPKKAFIIVGLVFVFGVFMLIFIFRGETAVKRKSFTNILEEKETKFYKKIVHFYKIKIVQ